jgi:hypothetical protein
MDNKALYKIEKISDRSALIFGTTYMNPISYLSDIEKTLVEAEFSGKVVFDLLLSNGYSSNRFVEAYADGRKIHMPSMKVISESNLDKATLDIIHSFYKAHSLLVEANEILLDEEKFRLIHS